MSSETKCKPSLTVRLQPGSRFRCQMEALQRETGAEYTITRHIWVVRCKARHKASYGVARWQVSRGLNCSIRRKWLQTAYCWYSTVASLESTKRLFSERDIQHRKHPEYHETVYSQRCRRSLPPLRSGTRNKQGRRRRAGRLGNVLHVEMTVSVA